MKKISIKKGVVGKSIKPGATAPTMIKQSIAHPKSDSDMSEIKSMGVAKTSKKMPKAAHKALKKLYK